MEKSGPMREFRPMPDASDESPGVNMNEADFNRRDGRYATKQADGA